EQESRLLGEVAVVENEQEFATVGLEPLDRVGNARREIPQIALADVILEGVCILVNGGNPSPALEHVGPLSRLVPVQLPNSAGGEPHIDAGNFSRAGQFARRRLPPPSAFLQMHMAVREGPS